MSRLYDTVEPSVVDEEMLQKAVEEQGPKEEAGKIAKEEGIDFGEVKKLRLDFKSKLSPPPFLPHLIIIIFMPLILLNRCA
jgi:hypothetical protein